MNIKIGDKEYFGSLIDDGYIDINGSGKLIIRYNKRLTPLFTDKDFTLLKHSPELVKKAHLSVNNAKDWNYTITDNEFIIINNDSKKLNYENEYFDNEK